MTPTNQIATVLRHSAQHLAMTMLDGGTTWAGVESRPYRKGDTGGNGCRSYHVLHL